MALERKDVRAKLDPDDHERMARIAAHDQMDIGEWVEQLILREIDRRREEARRASSLLESLDGAGITGKNRDSAGPGGSGGRR